MVTPEIARRNWTLRKERYGYSGGIRKYVMTEEHKRNISESLKGHALSIQHRKKISEAILSRGSCPPNVRIKISLSQKGKYIGELNSHWKGGKRAWVRRLNHRRRGLPTSNEMILLNEDFPNSEFHHTHVYDTDGKMFGIYLPKELHQSVRHRENRQSMDRMNWLSLEWLVGS